MLRERYGRQNIFEQIGTVSIAMEPVLMQLDRLLDDDVLFEAVKGDLSQRYRRTLVMGRGSTPVEVILRMLVVKHLYGWSYEQTEQWVSDSLVLRQFCRVYLEKVPDDTTLLRWANVIAPDTLHAVLDHVVDLARQHQVTKGRKLRIDGTVVETNLHYPTDSTLVADGVRVLSRLAQRANRALKGASTRGRDWLKQQQQAARQAVLKITDLVRRRGEVAAGALQAAYADLVTVSQTVLEQAEQVRQQLQAQTASTSRPLVQQLTAFVARVQQIIRQTRRRVMQGESVPAKEKLVSVFEPHTAIIRKGKWNTPVEFGRVVWLDEVEGGIVTRYAVLEGNPPDADQLAPSLDHHQHTFDQPPHLVAADRKVFSPQGQADAHQRGVRYVAIPKPGLVSAERRAYEQQPWFRSGRNWRAGLESRISLLKRRYLLKRCLYHGDDGMNRWVGWGIVAYDLATIAKAMVHD
jgi:IS5 family transposase